MSYIATTNEDLAAMLERIGVGSIDDLFAPIPKHLQVSDPLAIPSKYDQITLTKHYTALAARNAHADAYPTFLGGGVYDHYVPPTVGAITGRSEFYTSYTPYQPEMSQGTLQSIYEFQTLIAELYGMDIANASMYDASTGLAEAAIMACEIKNRKQVVALSSIDAKHLEVIRTYLRHMDMELVVAPAGDGMADIDSLKAHLSDSVAAVLVQHPNFWGNLEDLTQIGDVARSHGALLIAAVDPISLGLLKPPGEYGVDIAIGEGQSLGCTMGYGGPLLGLFACKKEYMRRLPGRIVGATKDIEGRSAYVMTLRTREQDIRRERATSNICTNVALYALAATVYLATMGKQGMRQVAELCVQKAHYAAETIEALDGYSLTNPRAKFFKEFSVTCPVAAEKVNATLWQHGIVGGLPVGERELLIAVTERRTKEEIDQLAMGLREAAKTASSASGTMDGRNGSQNGAGYESRSTATV